MSCGQVSNEHVDCSFVKFPEFTSKLHSCADIYGLGEQKVSPCVGETEVMFP